MITFYFVRHVETVWNKAGKFQGRTDIRLSGLGEEQAEKAAEWLKLKKLDGIVSSPLIRAARTAEAIAERQGLAVEYDSNLVELSFGQWEGKTFDEINSQWPGMMDEMFHNPGNIELPGGESFKQCQERCMKTIDRLISLGDEKTYAIVSHGAALRTIICGLIHIPLACSWNLALSNASITEVQHYPENLNVLNSLNFTAHLEKKTFDSKEKQPQILR